MTETRAAQASEAHAAAAAEYRIGLERGPKRVRVVFGDATVADSTRAILMIEPRHRPVYYFPRADVRMDLMRRTDHASHCPFKGDASYWTIEVGGRVAENAVWSYEEPFEAVSSIKDHVAFYRDRMDAWHEDDA